MKNFKILFSTVIMWSYMGSVQAQEYMYVSDIKPPSSVKIEGSDLNKYIDTTEFIYKGGMVLPNSYIRQNLKNGTYYQYFLQDTTKIAFELIYKNKTLIEFKSYWFNDTLKYTGHFVSGYSEGKYIGYHQNGRIRAIFIYTRGVHHEYLFYDADGCLRSHSKELDIDNGKYRLWDTEDYYPNGQLKQQGQTKNGYKIKTWTYYNQDGTIKEVKKHNGTEWLGSSN